MRYFYILCLKEVSSYSISLETKQLHTVLSCILLLTRQVRCLHACTVWGFNQHTPRTFICEVLHQIRKLFHVACSPQQLCKVGSTKLQINELKSRKTNKQTKPKWVSAELQVDKQWGLAKNKTKPKSNKQKQDEFVFEFQSLSFSLCFFFCNFMAFNHFPTFVS